MSDHVNVIKIHCEPTHPNSDTSVVIGLDLRFDCGYHNAHDAVEESMKGLIDFAVEQGLSINWNGLVGKIAKIIAETNCTDTERAKRVIEGGKIIEEQRNERKTD